MATNVDSISRDAGADSEFPLAAWEPLAAGPEPEPGICDPMVRKQGVYYRILVPVDRSETAQRGLAEAIKLAADQGAQLRVLHVASAERANAMIVYTPELLQKARADSAAMLNAAVNRARDAGIFAESRIVEHEGALIGTAIIADASLWGADLIVMGTHGRRGLNRALMGSTAEYVLRHARTPVLLLRAQGY